MITHYQQLTQVQQYQIEAGLTCGKSQLSIAKLVSVHPSTSSREVRRNRLKISYKATHLQLKSMIRRTELYKYSKPSMSLRQNLPAWLEDGMTLEQISARLRFGHLHIAVSHKRACWFLIKN